MTHSVPSTFSPSSLRITRSTPWVEGCCGPMLRTSSVESRKVASGIPRLLAAFDVQVLPHPLVVLLDNAVILAQRISDPLFRQQDAPHIGVSGEFDAEHVEHLALQPVSAGMDGHGAFRLVPFGDHRLHAHAGVPREAI